jgi:hypothetical protein
VLDQYPPRLYSELEYECKINTVRDALFKSVLCNVPYLHMIPVSHPLSSHTLERKQFFCRLIIFVTDESL